METSTLKHLKALLALKDLDALAQAVLDLQTADKFRFAAMLLEANRIGLAFTVGKRACDEIELARLLGKK